FAPTSTEQTPLFPEVNASPPSALSRKDSAFDFARKGVGANRATFRLFAKGALNSAQCSV
ncbi:hypothetical protein, partial [Pseudomonas syringae]|uniref:hypothetical protein n=1 Tax=Pseudomonas syringae TaxID=317 RepID=UPI001F2DA332